MSGEVGVRLTGDNSDFRAMLNDADRTTASTFEHIESHLTGTHAVATAVGTALGLHFTEIANNVDRLVLGFSEAEEASLKSIDEIGAQTAEVYAKAFASRNSQDQQLIAAQVEMSRLQKEQVVLQDQITDGSKAYTKAIVDQGGIEALTANATKATWEAKEKLAQNALEMAKQSAVIDAAQAVVDKTSLETAQKKTDAVIAGLETQPRLVALYAQQRDLEDQITNFQGQGKDLDVLKQEHLKVSGEIQAVQNQEQKDFIAFDRSYEDDKMKYVKDNYAVLLAQAKVYSGRTQAESDELKIFQLQNKELQTRLQIETILATPIEERTEAQKAQLNVLILQDQKILDMIAHLKGVVVETNNHGKALIPITAELQKQLDILNQIDSDQRLITNAKNTTYQFDGIDIAGASQTTDQLQSLSDAVLQKIIANAQSQIGTLEANKYTDPSSGAEIASGFLHRGEAEDVLKGTISNANSILGQRTQLRGADYNTALSQFQGNPADFDALYQSANATTDVLNQINTRLGNSPLFPLSGPTG